MLATLRAVAATPPGGGAAFDRSVARRSGYKRSMIVPVPSPPPQHMVTSA